MLGRSGLLDRVRAYMGKFMLHLKNWASGWTWVQWKENVAQAEWHTHSPKPLCSAVGGQPQGGVGGEQESKVARPPLAVSSPSLHAPPVGRGRPGVWDRIGRTCRKLPAPRAGAVDAGHLRGLAPPTQAPVSSEESPRPTPEGAF